MTDRYCVTAPDGACVSTDPRCMHQPQAEPTEVHVTYRHMNAVGKEQNIRFRQRQCDPLPPWAADVQVEAQPAGNPVGYISKTGHGTYFRETLTPELAALEFAGVPMWRPVFTQPTAGEPVAIVSSVVKAGRDGVRVRWLGGFPQIGDKLFTTPQPRKPLTDDWIAVTADKYATHIGGSGNDEVEFYPNDLIQFTRAVIAEYERINSGGQA